MHTRRESGASFDQIINIPEPHANAGDALTIHMSNEITAIHFIFMEYLLIACR